MSDSMRPHGLYRSMEFSRPEYWSGFLQGIFPTQGSNPGLLHCRQILYQLSHKGSSRILEWVAYPFSSRSSWPRNQTRISCISGGFFTNWAMREAHSFHEITELTLNSSDQNIKIKVWLTTWHFSNMVTHADSAVKKEQNWVIYRDVDGSRVCRTEWSKSENKYSILMHVCGL